MSGKGKQSSKRAVVKVRESGKTGQGSSSSSSSCSSSSASSSSTSSSCSSSSAAVAVAAGVITAATTPTPIPTPTTTPTPTTIATPAPTSTTTSNAIETNSESTETTMSLPILKTADNSRHLPRYSSLLQRSSEEGVGMEDLDTLQLELEMLLSSVVVRHRMLQDEIANLCSAETERRDKRSKSGKGLSLLDKRVREEKFKPKEINAKSQSPLPTKLFKQKATGGVNVSAPSVHEIARIEGSKSEAPKLLLPKNDTPNKFWASVDPYCTDIMPDDVKLLEELVATHGDISEFKKIPPLGRHYSLLWAHNDLLQEEDAANPSREKRKNNRSSDVSLLIQPKTEKKANGIAGPLTQRLVSALLEENVYVANNNTDNKLFRDTDPPVLRDLTIQNSINLELRMHKELVEQGILEPDAQKKSQEDDEILTEIKRCQQELTALSAHNVNQLRRLLSLAQEESKRQALKRRIATADNEVIEHYKKLILSKQRKIPLTKKEQEKAWACLRERENLLDQLNMLPQNNAGEPIGFNPPPPL